jgi:hypothetical protein
MTIKTIISSDSIEYFQPNGLKRWRKYEAIGDLKEGEDELEAAKELDAKIEAFHNNALAKLNPIQPLSNWNGVVFPSTDPVQIKKAEPEETRIGLFVEDINSCKDVETLKQYRLLVKGKPELQEAYDNKLKELQ